VMLVDIDHFKTVNDLVPASGERAGPKTARRRNHSPARWISLPHRGRFLLLLPEITEDKRPRWPRLFARLSPTPLPSPKRAADPYHHQHRAVIAQRKTARLWAHANAQPSPPFDRPCGSALYSAKHEGATVWGDPVGRMNVPRGYLQCGEKRATLGCVSACRTRSQIHNKGLAMLPHTETDANDSWLCITPCGSDRQCSGHPVPLPGGLLRFAVHC